MKRYERQNSLKDKGNESERHEREIENERTKKMKVKAMREKG